MVKKCVKGNSFLILILLAWLHFDSFGQRREKFIGCIIGFDLVVNDYADSLNFINSSDDLPHFLNDYLIDWKRKDAIVECLADRDEGISYRRSIFARVINEKPLQWIVASKNKNYDKLYDPEKLEMESIKSFDNDFPVLPFMQYSTRELAKKRLEELRKIKNKFKKK